MKPKQYLVLLAVSVTILVLGHSSPVAAGETRVNPDNYNSQTNPSVAMDNSGDFVVTWQVLGQGNQSYDVYAQRFNDSGTPLGGRITVTTDT